MHRSTLSSLIGFAFSAMTAAIVMALSACATPPVQAMSDARQAVQAAKEAGAPTYAPRLYAEATHWLSEAEFALKHWDYARARKSAIQAAHSARAAILAARKSQAPTTATSTAPIPASTSSPSLSNEQGRPQPAH